MTKCICGQYVPVDRNCVKCNYEKVTDPEKIDRIINTWHDDDEDGRSLEEALCWTKEEYRDWLVNDRIPNG